MRGSRGYHRSSLAGSNHSIFLSISIQAVKKIRKKNLKIELSQLVKVLFSREEDHVNK